MLLVLLLLLVISCLSGAWPSVLLYCARPAACWFDEVLAV
jgi:hypothetical protein